MGILTIYVKSIVSTTYMVCGYTSKGYHSGLEVLSPWPSYMRQFLKERICCLGRQIHAIKKRSGSLPTRKANDILQNCLPCKNGS